MAKTVETNKGRTAQLYTFGELLDRVEWVTQCGLGKLAEDAVELAREFLTQQAREDEWWHRGVTDLWADALNQIGFSGVEFNWTGFSCQGDGCSFVADVDMHELIGFWCDPTIVPENEIGYDEIEKQELYKPWLAYQFEWQEGIAPVNYRKLLFLVESDDLHDVRIYRTEHQYCHERTCEVTLSFNEQSDWDDDGEWHPKHPRVSKLVKDFEEDLEALRLLICRRVYKQLEQEYDWIGSDEFLRQEEHAMFTVHGHFIEYDYGLLGSPTPETVEPEPTLDLTVSDEFLDRVGRRSPRRITRRRRRPR